MYHVWEWRGAYRVLVRISQRKRSLVRIVRIVWIGCRQIRYIKRNVENIFVRFVRCGLVNAYRQGTTPLGRPRRWWQYIIKMVLKEIG